MDNQNNKKNDNNNRQNYGIIIITTIIAAVFVMFLYQLMQDTPSQEISYTKFMDMVEKGEVKEVTIDSEKITIIPKTEAEKNQENENSQGGITQGRSRGQQYDSGFYIHDDFKPRIQCDCSVCTCLCAAQFSDAKSIKKQWGHDGDRKEQCQNVCGKDHGGYVP